MSNVQALYTRREGLIYKSHLPFSDVLSVHAAVLLAVSAHVIQAQLLEEHLNDVLVVYLLP